MYVKRCGFYIKDKRIVRKDIWVPWDMDMSMEGRDKCIGIIRELLDDCPRAIVDTTSASPNHLGKRLSTFWNKVEGMTCNEAYDYYKKNCDDEDELVPGIYEYIYYLSLQNNHLRFIRQTGTFTNMFFNPDRKKTCEALACCALKLLEMQNKLDYIYDAEALSYWFYCNVGCMKIITAGDKPEEYEERSSSEYDEEDFELPFA